MKKISYRIITIFLLMMLIFVPYLFVIIKYSTSYYDSRLTMAKTVADMALDDGGRAVDGVINGINTCMLFLCNSDDVNGILNNADSKSIVERIEEKNRLSRIMSALLLGNADTRMKIYTTNPKGLCGDYIVAMTPQVSETADSFGENGVGVRCESVDGENYLTFYRRYVTNRGVQNIMVYSQPVYELVNLLNDDADDSLLYISYDDEFYVSLRSGELLGGDDAQAVSKSIERRYTLSFMGLSICSVIDYDALNSLRAKTGCVVAVAIVLSVAALLVIVIKVSDILSKGIMMIIAEIDGGNSERTDSYYGKELKIIYDYILQMKKQLQQENDEKLKYELKALMNRISPHFLYNSLSSLQKLSDNPDTKRGISLIVSYYRYVFRNDTVYVPLKKEIDFVNIYIELIRITYESSFEFNIYADDKLLGTEIISNMLQPLVENAFIHGVNILESNALIELRITADGDRIFIKVLDNGNNADIESINKKIISGDGVLSLINKRLQLVYPGRNRFYACVEQEMTCVCIEIDNNIPGEEKHDA